MVIHVNCTDIRPHFSELIGKVEHGGEQLIILRYNYPVAAVVSLKDHARIAEKQLEEVLGPPGGPSRTLITMADVMKGFWKR